MEIQPVQFGFSNLIAFNDKLGLEANIGMGYTVLLEDIESVYNYNGFNLTPEVKFRYNSLAIGFQISNSFYFDSNTYFYNTGGYIGSVNTYMLTIGGKF